MARWLRTGMRALRPSRPFGDPSGRTCVGQSLPSRNEKLLFFHGVPAPVQAVNIPFPTGLELQATAQDSHGAAGPDNWTAQEWSTSLWMSSIRCLSSFEPLPLPGMCRSSYGSLAWFASPRKAKFTTTVSKLVMPGQSASCLCGGAFGAHRSVVAPPFVPGFVLCFWRMLVASLEKIFMRTSLRSLTTSQAWFHAHFGLLARPLTVLTATSLAACFVLMDGLLIWFIYWKQLGVSRSDLCNGDHHTHSSTLDASRVQPQGDPWGPLLMSLWVQAGVQTVLQTCETPESDISIKTYLDDRSCTARNCCQTSWDLSCMVAVEF